MRPPLTPCVRLLIQMINSKTGIVLLLTGLSIILPPFLTRGAIVSAQGTLIRAEPALLRVQDMTGEELWQRLAEYEQGKRDYRDGYIILNQLWFSFQVSKQTNSAEFKTIAAKRDALLKQHPELNDLQDFRLSEHIKQENILKQREAERLEKAKRWVPLDRRFMDVRTDGKELVVVYQYRIEFIHLDDTIRYNLTVAGPNYRTGPAEPGKFGKIGVASDFAKRGADGSFKSIPVEQLKPYKVWHFKYRVQVLPKVAPLSEPSQNLLICSNPLDKTYSAAHNDEEAKHMVGRYHTMEWVNPHGTIGETCRVIDHTGKAIYEFPLEQRLPGPLALPLWGTGNNGQRAGIMVGRAVPDEDSGSLYVGELKELWIWTAPATLKKFHPEPPKEFFDLNDQQTWVKKIIRGENE